MITKDRFTEIIAPLGKVFKPLDQLAFDVYFERLKWGDEGTFMLAAEKLLDTHRFSTFQLIEEFKEAIDKINVGSIVGTEEDYGFRDKNQCAVCGGEGRYLVYLDEHKKEVGWELRNERTVRAIARFCSCWFGRRIAAAQGQGQKRLEEKRRKRWREPGEDRAGDAPF
jgi:hypothetical protein